MRLQLLVFIIMYLNLTSGQDAIVSEITRHTSPTGQSAFVHHRRQFSQKLQHKGQLTTNRRYPTNQHHNWLAMN